MYILSFWNIVRFRVRNALIKAFMGEKKKVEMQEKTRGRSCQQAVIGSIQKINNNNLLNQEGY